MVYAMCVCARQLFASNKNAHGGHHTCCAHTTVGRPATRAAPVGEGSVYSDRIDAQAVLRGSGAKRFYHIPTATFLRTFHRRMEV